MCGVVGVYGKENATELTLDMMEALQHRGHQSSGCVLQSLNGEVIFEKELGVVENLYHKLIKIDAPTNTAAGIGHLRYGTAGSRNSMENAQPLYIGFDNIKIYLSQNGDTPYYFEMRKDLEGKGVEFTISSDTELIRRYIELSKSSNPIDAIIEGLSCYKGSYAMTILLNDFDGWKLIAARDKSGNRPLLLGRRGNNWLVASEDVAFEAVEGEFIREINRGEMLIISKNKIESRTIEPKYIFNPYPQFCIFEKIYFSFPNSTVFGVPVDEFQEKLGTLVAQKLRHNILESDVITNIPDSSNIFMDGFAIELKMFPTREIIRKHNYRSFIGANQVERKKVIRKKFSFSKYKVRGKRVWVLDDSIVRGNTSRKIIRALRKHGATWVGMISSAPPIIGECRKGIDFEDDLVAEGHSSVSYEQSIEDIKNRIEADCLYYTTIEDLHTVLKACNANPKFYCYGCFTGKEPVFGAW